MNSFDSVSADGRMHKKALVWRVFPNIVAFGIGLGVAWFLEWETTDLVWSLWLCSLVLGYLTILSAIFGGAWAWIHITGQEDLSQKNRTAALVAGIGMGLFLLGFFSIHFCGFHAGHSVFLRQFFPVEGMPAEGFGAAFMNPPLLWALAFKHLAVPYGIFLVPALIVERRHVFAPFIQAVHMVNGRKTANGSGTDPKTSAQKFFGNAMGRPYINVVRMHILIFFFALCFFLKIDSFAVYAVVYFVYFFPWHEVKNSWRQVPAGAV
ncbi:DUF6498-containing protein [Desulfosudis oleivorans]|uniref:Uncharacterized protein n=1 Tax=Desulfosudis oleivorans (strain DSM 6200 / JCM 39069 / Hxd3) TaxID=96561 RepID=A8ZVD7_DESOH|nr:DUF6498-containing protein [Desulfosudis oleivorans]ABW66598.1 hypothetical protein Dole_0788 [Desulfosudis oleivorans Hxd3]